MSVSFSWNDLPNPFFALAPMEDVTDTVFRQIVASAARPDVFFTEFTNTDGILSRGADIVTQRLKYTEIERPLIAQIWGIHPESFYKAAQEIVKLGFDGIDINMGCPIRNIVKIGACSALINNHALTKEIIDATKKGAGSASRRIPISIKTRIGFNKIVTQEWIGFLLNQDLAALTIHGRTAAEMSAVPVHWDEIEKAVILKNTLKVKTLLIGNGDIKNREQGLELVKKYQLDGIMIGRGVFENPWVFQKEQKIISKQERLLLLKKHVHLFKQTWSTNKNFQVLKKYFKIYIAGFPNAAEIRQSLMQTNSFEEINSILDKLVK